MPQMKKLKFTSLLLRSVIEHGNSPGTILQTKAGTLGGLGEGQLAKKMAGKLEKC